VVGDGDDADGREFAGDCPWATVLLCTVCVCIVQSPTVALLVLLLLLLVLLPPPPARP
jgi:hypothetical protein